MDKAAGSLRTVKKLCPFRNRRVRGRSLYRSSRKRVRRLEGKQAVPFSLGPDPREDQGLPPTALPSRDARGVGTGKNGGGFTDGFGNVPGSHVGGNFDDGFVAWLEVRPCREHSSAW